jgi:hypothetical protein
VNSSPKGCTRDEGRRIAFKPHDLLRRRPGWGTPPKSEWNRTHRLVIEPTMADRRAQYEPVAWWFTKRRLGRELRNCYQVPEALPARLLTLISELDGKPEISVADFAHPPHARFPQRLLLQLASALERLAAVRRLILLVGGTSACPVASEADKSSRSAASQCCSASLSGQPLANHIS